MQGSQKQLIEAYQRVQAFLGANPAPDPASYAEPKRVLDEVVAELMDHSSAQVSGQQSSQAEKRRQDAAMRTLRDRHMRPIVRVARFAIQLDPGIEQDLRMPTSTLGVVKLLSAAKTMREKAAPYKEVFVKNGLPADFLERFVEAESAVARATVNRGTNVGKHVGARAGLTDQLKRGRRAVDALDAIVLNAFADKPVVLAAWRVAKRVKALPGGGRITTSDSPATPPAVTPEAA